MPDDLTVVLVHGAWHGAWCWEKVTTRLDDEGITWSAVDLPFTSFEDDVAATRAAIDGAGGPVLLCAHSYGGAVISAAGGRPNVQRLVYLAAFACDEGESPASTAPEAEAPTTDLERAFVLTDDGSAVAIKEDAAAQVLYHDCSPEDVAATLERLRPIHLACLTAPVQQPAWRDKPSTYVVCAEDRAVHPELQRVMAKRCTESLEWPTAHSPFLNRPDLVAGLLVDLVSA